MYKNRIDFFSLLFITQNVRTGKSKKVEDDWATHTGANGTYLQWNLFSIQLFGSKSRWLYNILDAHANSRGHISSNPKITRFSMAPTQFTWSSFLLTLPPRYLCGVLTGETRRPVYFRYQVHFLLFLFLDSDFYRCIDVLKGVFKTISNISYNSSWSKLRQEHR